ncbi:MAG TPA: hypothetical protein VIO35_03365 [Chloroflexota bacterium]
MAYLLTEADVATVRNIVARHETAVVVEAANGGYDILGIANYPSACRETYIGRLILAVFRSEYDLEARLALARATNRPREGAPT